MSKEKKMSCSYKTGMVFWKAAVLRWILKLEWARLRSQHQVVAKKMLLRL